jgi:hypothetical protein
LTEFEVSTMAEQSAGARPNDRENRTSPDSSELDRVQELTWALLDEQIADDEKSWLESALSSSAEARDTYLRCVQIHTDLMAHFSKTTATTAKPAAISPVLGFLHGGVLSLEFQPPAADQATP